MNDRSFVDAVYQRCLDRASAWQSCSSTVGLLESSNKAQALAKTKTIQAKLNIDRPQWVQQKTMKVLGASLRAPPAKSTEEENQRLAAAINRSKLLGCIPLPWRRKLELYRVFVLPKALFGWISKRRRTHCYPTGRHQPPGKPTHSFSFVRRKDTCASFDCS